MNMEALAELIKWAQETFEPGCYLGDLCREPIENMSEDEEMNLICAHEGYLAR